MRFEYGGALLCQIEIIKKIKTTKIIITIETIIITTITTIMKNKIIITVDRIKERGDTLWLFGTTPGREIVSLFFYLIVHFVQKELVNY